MLRVLPFPAPGPGERGPRAPPGPSAGPACTMHSSEDCAQFPFPPPALLVAFLCGVGSSSQCSNISCWRWKAAQTVDLGSSVPQPLPARPRSGRGLFSQAGVTIFPSQACLLSLAGVSALSQVWRLFQGRGWGMAVGCLAFPNLKVFPQQPTLVWGAGPSLCSCRIRRPRL